MQYYSVKINIRTSTYTHIHTRAYTHTYSHTQTQKSLVRKSRKATVETILKQLEYIIKGNVATQTILF